MLDEVQQVVCMFSQNDYSYTESSLCSGMRFGKKDISWFIALYSASRIHSAILLAWGTANHGRDEDCVLSCCGSAGQTRVSDC